MFNIKKPRLGALGKSVTNLDAATMLYSLSTEHDHCELRHYAATLKASKTDKFYKNYSI
ncbi:MULTISPECIES: hypothetical protein [unclassified Acinetobacter]|uniref:hypothetical protein n=1 Tax=unclassified Acinetobacter TaxID=196816 RepID=UPI0013C33705|nr:MULTISPECIES: hypothetical protein [unclassified Acinetobacter]